MSSRFMHLKKRDLALVRTVLVMLNMVRQKLTLNNSFVII